MKLSSITCAPVLVATLLVGCADKPAATPADDSTRTTSATPTNTTMPVSDTNQAPSHSTIPSDTSTTTSDTSTTRSDTGSASGSGAPSSTWNGAGNNGSSSTPVPTQGSATQMPSPTTGTSQSSPNADADNTRMNKRDRDGAAVLPMEQGNSAGDIKITQVIRQAVVSDSAMSFNAKNVKIITKDGHVVLRGTVNTQAERTAIEAKAKAAAGVVDVQNLIDVKK